MVGRKVGANATRLHDEVVFTLANLLFRSIGVDPAVEPVRLFDADPDLDDRRSPDILIRSPRGFDRQAILDVAATSVALFGRVAYNDPYKPLEDRRKQKINKRQRVANHHGLQLAPAAFSHAGQMHGEVKRFIKEQIRLQREKPGLLRLS